jgi:formyltetrahydrofolate hydrolase
MFYALWYYINENNNNISKSTNAISNDINNFYKLQNDIELNFNCSYQNYKKLIKNIIVQPIKCYIYENKSQKLKEILIYLTKEDHEILLLNLHLNKNNEKNNKNLLNNLYSSFFYNESISYHYIEPDIYYEEGIMNT